MRFAAFRLLSQFCWQLRSQLGQTTSQAPLQAEVQSQVAWQADVQSQAAPQLLETSQVESQAPLGQSWVLVQ